jgi:2-polyprenyl-3-methyl-5-hydroxy-6-metoxy-1,4-benzoquinol methylase
VTERSYYERYWSEEGYRPTGVIDPTLERLFGQHVSPTARCLDVGCGDGSRSGPWLSEHAASYVGIDISATAVELARAAGLDARVIADAAELPSDDGTFDVVVCVEVLEHLFEPQRAAAEAFRVLSTGGVYLVSVPNVAYWRRRLELGLLARWNPFGDELSTREPWRDPHIRFFTPKTLRRMLVLQGFRVTSVVGVGGCLLPDLPLVRRAVARRASRP